MSFPPHPGVSSGKERGEEAEGVEDSVIETVSGKK